MDKDSRDSKHATFDIWLLGSYMTVAEVGKIVTTIFWALQINSLQQFATNMVIVAPSIQLMEQGSYQPLIKR